MLITFCKKISYSLIIIVVFSFLFRWLHQTTIILQSSYYPVSYSRAVKPVNCQKLVILKHSFNHGLIKFYFLLINFCWVVTMIYWKPINISTWQSRFQFAGRILQHKLLLSTRKNPLVSSLRTLTTSDIVLKNLEKIF